MLEYHYEVLRMLSQSTLHRLEMHLWVAIATVMLAACSRGSDSRDSGYSLAVANQFVSSGVKNGTGGSSSIVTGTVQGIHGMDALPSGWQRNPTQCQPSAVPPAKATCFDASASQGLSYCDTCNYDTHCSGPNGTCVQNASDASSAIPILGCSGVQADLTVRFPCLDSGDVVHIPLCNRGHDAIAGLVWIGIYSGASNIPSCATPGTLADKGQVSFDTSQQGGLLPGQCVDVHFSRTDTKVDGNIHDKLGWSTSSLPNGNPPRAVAVNFNATVHECDYCNNWTVFNADQCGTLPSSGVQPGNGTGGSTAGVGGASTVGSSAGGTSSVAQDATGGASAQMDGTGGVSSVVSSTTDVVTAVVGVTDANGLPVPLVEDGTTVSVDTRSPGGDWTSVNDVVAGFGTKAPIDVVVVADNSGSEVKHISEMRNAIRQFAASVLAHDPLNRIGLVRVSTTAKVLLPLTEDLNTLLPVLDGLASRKGWTALLDGIALGNQTLEAGASRALNRGTFCYAGPYRSVVVFTDGKENNSLGQHLYVENGTENTTVSALSALSVGGMRTAVYTVGIGNSIDEANLSVLASNSGGRYVHVADYASLASALVNAAAQLDALLAVCFSPIACSDTEARVTVAVHRAGGDTVSEQTVQLPVLCK